MRDAGLPLEQLPDVDLMVAPGWRGLLRRYHERLAELDPWYRVADARERAGRFLAVLVPELDPGGRPDEERSARGARILWELSEESVRTCQLCGDPGRPRRPGDRPRGWLKTVCDGCQLLRS